MTANMPPNNIISQAYLNQSCDGCRSKRTKCDRKRPSCTECLKRGLQCEASHKLSCRSGCNDRVAKIEFEAQGLNRKVKEQNKELEERTRESRSASSCVLWGLLAVLRRAGAGIARAVVQRELAKRTSRNRLKECPRCISYSFNNTSLLLIFFDCGRILGVVGFPPC